MGLAPGVTLHAIKVCKRLSPSSIETTTNSFTLAEGLDYAIQKRVQIINVSIGGPRSPLSYPAAYCGVIGVTAIDEKMCLYPRAPHGRFVDIAAPGVDIFSLKPGNRYNFYTGTSFAAAYVTGILALRLSSHTKATSPSASRDPLTFLRTVACRPTRYTPDETGVGILILSKIPAKTFH